MELGTLLESFGERNSLAAIGLVVGALFGACAQRSRFCLRSAVIEFWRRSCADRLAVWLFAFASAIVGTQMFILLGWLDVGEARQLAARGSLSGALVGGLLFGVGLTVAGGWLLTYRVTSQSFELLPVKSLSFTSPSADMLMLVLPPPGRPVDFDIGLVPGVALGSFLAALVARELKLEGFKDGLSMRRYIVGAVCMGFGGMLAGGCAVGAAPAM